MVFGYILCMVFMVESLLFCCFCSFIFLCDVVFGKFLFVFFWPTWLNGIVWVIQLSFYCLETLRGSGCLTWWLHVVHLSLPQNMHTQVFRSSKLLLV